MLSPVANLCMSDLARHQVAMLEIGHISSPAFYLGLYLCFLGGGLIRFMVQT